MKIILRFAGLLLLIVSCKQPYQPPLKSMATGYLVVEGFMNSTAHSPSSIQLTRTSNIGDTSHLNFESQAAIVIEGDAGDSYPLKEIGKGFYLSDSISLLANEHYHLRIQTLDGKVYQSDEAPVQTTPDIDSISWTRENGGVGIYVNAHDDQNMAKYYRWSYDETWEFHSPNICSLKYRYDSITDQIVGLEYRFPLTHFIDSSILICWKTIPDAAITLGTTEKLQKDMIYQHLAYIEPGSFKLSVLYSLGLHQYAISRQAYLFYQTLKKNTEQLGTLFDVQPTELPGNIHCLNNPNEPVIGFVEVAEEKFKRFYLSNQQVPDWAPFGECPFVILDAVPDTIRKYGHILFPTVPFKVSLGIDSYSAVNDQNCTDCTLRGTNIRPDFWPK
jgi:hypothetical protein